jgi:hypothetical protein
MISKLRHESPLRLVHCIPKKFLRVFLVGSLITLGLIIHVFQGRASLHRGPHEPADKVLNVVHGKKVSGVTKQLYPLKPFPSSPLETHHGDSNHDRPPNPWLVAVICAASDAEHRMMIRSSWMRLFADLPYDARFVVSNPGPSWTPMVAMENGTYGDMIVLDAIQEDDITANTIKTTEFYRWLVSNGRRYEYVTKLDTDLWFNPRGFWDRYLLPRLSNTTGHFTATVNRTLIGELHYAPTWDLAFPNGGLYTVTWDLLELLVSLQERFHVVTGEDMTNSILLQKGRETARIVNLKGTEKFNYDDRDSRGDGTAWARAKTHRDAISHAMVAHDPIAIHFLKEPRTWFKVADCFDENGIKEMPPARGPDPSPPPSLLFWDFLRWTRIYDAYKPRILHIPESFWSLENGEWICDGVWNMGPTRDGWNQDTGKTESWGSG